MSTGLALLVFLHIFFVVVIFGPLLVFGVILPGWIKQGPEMAPVAARMHKLLDHIGMTTPLVFLLGVFIVIDAKGIDFSDGWISASMALFIVALAIAKSLVATTSKKAVEKLAAGQSAEAEADKLRLWNTVLAVIFVVILWLMIKKPGA